MKFAHMADCHLGGWRDPLLRDLNTQCFKEAIDTCISEKVDFALICGDLFNTAIPGIDIIRDSMVQLKRLRGAGIGVYVIPGSHDYSPAGKTVIDILQEADLCVNVFKGKVQDGKLVLSFTTDNKTGVKMTGILGKRGSLETNYYDSLDIDSLESEEGAKIFLYHSPIEEYKGSSFHSMPAVALSQFPKGFLYYAGGHVHTVMNRAEKGFGTFAYPGPLFPNSFSEIEELECGGMYIVETHDEKLVINRHEFKLKPVVKLSYDCSGKSSAEISLWLSEQAEKTPVKDALVLIRLFGTITSGSTSDIRFREAFEVLLSRGAYFVMRNTRALENSSIERVKPGIENAQEIESSLIAEHAEQIKLPGELLGKEQELFAQILTVLSSEKADGETVHDFEQRLIKDSKRTLRLD